MLSPSGVRQIRFSGFFPFSCFLARLAHSGCSSLGSRRGVDVWIRAEETEALARRRAAIAAAHDLCAVSMLQGRLSQAHMDQPEGGNDKQVGGGEYCDGGTSQTWVCVGGAEETDYASHPLNATLRSGSHFYLWPSHFMTYNNNSSHTMCNISDISCALLLTISLSISSKT